MTILTRNHAELTIEVAKHIEADAVIQGEYWDGNKGCFIGCLTHSSDPNPAHERFGLPEPLLRIAESIFEYLPADDAKGFFAALPDAVGRDGKDMSKVHWSFLAAELRALPTVRADIQAVINLVIEGMDTLASGGKWSKAAANAVAPDIPRVASYAASYAARAAFYAARAADAASYATAASYAAAAASYAAAADAARAAATMRQRGTLLRLISEAE